MVRLVASSSQLLSRNSGTLLNMNSDYTIAGWLYYEGGSAEQGIVVLRNNGNANGAGDLLRLDVGKFDVLVVGDSGVTNNSGTTLSSSTWYHCAMVRSGNTVYGYLNAVQDCSVTDTIALRGTMGCMVLGATDNAGGGSFMNGGFRGWKAWSRALSAVELQREMRQVEPVSRVSLYDYWPLATFRRAEGFANGYGWTESNSPGDSSPARIAWSSPRTLAVLPAAGGGGTTVTPGVASLSLTAYTPSVTTPVTCTPGVASLSLTTYAVTLGEVVTPGVASLTTTTYAPTVTAPLVCTPGVASLSLTAYTPSVGQPVQVTPGTASLALSMFTPTVSTPVTCTPGVASLSLTAYAPTTALSETVVPGVATLTLTAYAPDIGFPVTCTPGTAALTLTRYEPAVAAPDGTTVGYLMRVTQGGTVVASTASRVPLSTAHEVSMHVNCIVTVGSGTVKVQVLADDVSAARTLLDNASQGDTATIITATKVMD